MLKEINRTIEAWMAVYNLEQGAPFYRMRASIEDKPEVERIEAGHFALSFCVQAGQAEPLPALVDPEKVFGPNTSWTAPDRFAEQSLDRLISERQITEGRTP